ncbi:MAG TPA: BamA/TamA family outer membrane protein, partial [Atribacterota bacterium]|nr:BamA/TamA family outer membrane protein [Atribacterota bacterium]
GNNLFYTSLEYRFPIKTVEEKVGFDWASIFLERISGSLFLDAGHAWGEKFNTFHHKINASVGAELIFKFNSAHNSPFNITLGVGKPITESSPFRFYFQTGISF